MLTQLLSCHASEPFMGVLAIPLLVVLAIVVGVDFIIFGRSDASWLVIGGIWPLMWDLNHVTSCVYLGDFSFYTLPALFMLGCVRYACTGILPFPAKGDFDHHPVQFLSCQYLNYLPVCIGTCCQLSEPYESDVAFNVAVDHEPGPVARVAFHRLIDVDRPEHAASKDYFSSFSEFPCFRPRQSHQDRQGTPLVTVRASMDH